MSPALKHEIPQRVVAQFGLANNPLFLVERTENLFLIRDADQGLAEGERRLGLVAINRVDVEARQAEVEIELDPQPGEASYTMTAGDLVGAIGAVARDEDFAEVRIAPNSDLPEDTQLAQLVGPQELKSSNPQVKPYAFEIAA